MFKWLRTTSRLISFGSARGLTNDSGAGPEVEDDLIHAYTP